MAFATRIGDPLLAATRLLLLITVIIFCVGGVGALGALIPIWLYGNVVTAWLAAHADGGTVGHDALAAISVMLIGLAAIDALSIQFLRKLIAIIDSVGKGSPFIPDNATRLRAMGWLVLAIQALGLGSLPLSGWLRHATANHHFFVPFSLEGLVGSLLLFILARVFDFGTRLAEDVEGMV